MSVITPLPTPLLQPFDLILNRLVIFTKATLVSQSIKIHLWETQKNFKKPHSLNNWGQIRFPDLLKDLLRLCRITAMLMSV